MKRILAIIIAAAIFVSPVISVKAIMAVTPAEPGQPDYIYKSGVIAEISELAEAKRVVVNIREGETAVFMIDGDTFFFEGGMSDIKAGANITGLFDSSLPMMMIYPPQYRIAYLAVGYKTLPQITVDRFNENFICSKNNLKLNITDKTEIIFEDGTEFKGDIAELAGRKLLVYQGQITTASIPGINMPEKIIIFYETAVHPILTLTPEEIREFMMVYDNAVIQVNGETIAHRAYLSDSNHVMVPVRAIAEAMGLHVEWFGDTQSVQVGRSLSFAIGTDAYAFARMAPVSLGQAPVLRRLDSRNSLTYVPIDFFVRQELGATAAGYMAEFDEELDAQVINIIFDVTE